MISRPIKPVADAPSLGAELATIAVALLGEAIGHLREPHRSGVESAVHETRKRIKEVRALLRLAGDSLVDAAGQPARPQANQSLRIAAGALSEARDSAVMLQTLDSLVSGSDGAISAPAVAPLRDELVRLKQEAAEQDAAGVQTALPILEHVLAGITQWRLAADGKDAWATLDPNIRRIYRRGRRAMQDAADSPDAETWHTWRRRAKDVRYALELVREAAPELLSPMAKLGKSVTDHLGTDHDLAVLKGFVSGSKASFDVGPALMTLIDSRSNEQRVVAQHEGAILFAERPRDLVRRVGAYWRSIAPQRC